ncbi:MAG TPA: hypothetical protein VFR47_19170 [Anaerolineales bacterium]|nr:hypothetical protein [Anaerolineales bacterium]
MNEEQTGQEPLVPDRIPQRIYEGMPVYDHDGEVVGKVRVMYYGGASEEAIQKMLESEEAGTGDASGFDADNVPKELRARFMRQGYILIEGPDLTGVKRYIGPEQIEGIVTQDIEGRMTDTVRLRATRAELINAD